MVEERSPTQIECKHELLDYGKEDLKQVKLLGESLHGAIKESNMSAIPETQQLIKEMALSEAKGLVTPGEPQDVARADDEEPLDEQHHNKYISVVARVCT